MVVSSLSNLLRSVSAWSWFWVCFAGLIAVTVRLAIFVSSFLPPGQELLDARFGWSVDDVIALFDALGESGRHKYLRVYTDGHDILFPIIFTAMFSFLLSLLFDSDSKLRLTNLLPFFCSAFDLLENYCICQMLSLFPGHIDAMTPWSNVGSLANMIKYIMLALISAVTLFGIYASVHSWWSKRGDGEKEKEKEKEKKKD